MAAIPEDLVFENLEDFPVQDIQFPDLPSENPDDKVKLKSTFHFFRSFSELKNEAKGGYIEAEIEVPENVETIKIALVTHHTIPEPHVNLLFVTPKVKSSKEKCLELKPEDHAVMLTKVNDQFGIVNPRYWPNGVEEFFGPNFYKDGKLVLGKSGLQLTICKAGQKSKTDIHQVFMQNYLGIDKFMGDFSKARLEITCDNSFPIYSKVIFDKNKHLLKTEEILTPQICNQGDQIITLVLDSNAKITKDKNLKLILFYDPLNEETFQDFQVLSDNVVKFKINAKGHENFKDKVLVCVTVDDQDMDDSTYFDQFSEDVFIQIEEHHEDSSPKCYCQRGTKKFQSSRKRKNEMPLVHPVSSKPRWAAQAGHNILAAGVQMARGQIAESLDTKDEDRDVVLEAQAATTNSPRWTAQAGHNIRAMNIADIPEMKIFSSGVQMAQGQMAESLDTTDEDRDVVLEAQAATTNSPRWTAQVVEIATGDSPNVVTLVGPAEFQSADRYLDQDRYRSAGPGMSWKDHLFGFLRKHWLDILLALISIALFYNCDVSGKIEEFVCALIILGLVLISKWKRRGQNEELEVPETVEETHKEKSDENEDVYEEYDDDEPSWLGYGSSDKD